jgi:hypothetical protein
MTDRGDLRQARGGVRFEASVQRFLVGLAKASNLTYSELIRVLVDEAILARLSRPGLDGSTLREAVLHAIDYQVPTGLITVVMTEAEYIGWETGRWEYRGLVTPGEQKDGDEEGGTHGEYITP